MMKAFIDPPKRIPFYLRLGIWITKRVTGQELLPAKLLAWYPKAAISSGTLEALVAHRDNSLDERMLKLVRLQASLTAACPFCIDMNSIEDAHARITPEELAALQGRSDVESVATFSVREKLAIEYTQLISRTPLSFPPAFIQKLVEHFSEREMVTIGLIQSWQQRQPRSITGRG
jgi:alkylhydroperoxidase family enzyme